MRTWELRNKQQQQRNTPDKSEIEESLLAQHRREQLNSTGLQMSGHFLESCERAEQLNSACSYLYKST